MSGDAPYCSDCGRGADDVRINGHADDCAAVSSNGSESGLSRRQSEFDSPHRYQFTPYYSKQGVTIYHGDALDVLPQIQSAGAVILDPPYSFESLSVRGRDDGAAGTSGSPVRLFHQTLADGLPRSRRKDLEAR